MRKFPLGVDLFEVAVAAFLPEGVAWRGDPTNRIAAPHKGYSSLLPPQHVVAVSGGATPCPSHMRDDTRKTAGTSSPPSKSRNTLRLDPINHSLVARGSRNVPLS